MSRISVTSAVGIASAAGALLLAPTTGFARGLAADLASAAGATPAGAQTATTGGSTRLSGQPIGIGDGRGSEPCQARHEMQQGPQGDKPLPHRCGGSVPRYGADLDPSSNRVEWSYDWKPPVDSNRFHAVEFPWIPETRPLLPRDLLVVQNHTSTHDPHDRGMQDQRREVDPSDQSFNMVTTDVVIPGAGRLVRVDMGCPRHGRRVGPEQRPSHEDHDGYWTGATTFDLRDRHLTFSYQMGDTVVDDAWLWAHYFGYSALHG